MHIQAASLQGLIGFASILAAILVCLKAGAIGQALHVMDHPDAKRKRHAHATPLVGGLAILIALLIWLSGNILWGIPPDAKLSTALALCAAGVGLVGFADDQSETSPLSRILSLLVFLVIAFVIDSNLIAEHLTWGRLTSVPVPRWAFCALMAVASVGVVNAVNMADGQNGLVSSMFVIWPICLALVGGEAISATAEVLAAASFVVLLFNLRGKLFLGDCGSYGVTFVLGLLTMSAYAHGRVSIETITVWFFIPVMDCLRLLITRLLQGRSPAQGDRDHFHHRLQDQLGKEFGLTAYIGSVATSSLVAALAPQLAFACILVLTGVYFSFAWLTDSGELREPGQANAGLSADMQTPTNVVPITSSERIQKREQG